MNVLVTFVLLATSWTYPRVDSDIATYSQSAATVDNVVAAYINPAGLAPRFVMGLRYMHAFTDSSFKGDDGFILASKGNCISIQWLKHTNGVFRRKYTLAAGKSMAPNFYWGISYAWFGGSDMYSKKKVWKTGFQYHLKNNFSFGFVIDDINRPKFGDVQTERFYTLGTAFFSDQKKITFSIDAYFEEKSWLDDAEAMFRLELKPSKSIKIVGDYRTEGFFRIGLAYFLGYVDIGISSRFYENDYLGGNFYYNQGPMPGAK